LFSEVKNLEHPTYHARAQDLSGGKTTPKKARDFRKSQSVRPQRIRMSDVSQEEEEKVIKEESEESKSSPPT
jgi:hypothetical protein